MDHYANRHKIIVKLYQQGSTKHYIARELSLSMSTINRTLKRYRAQGEWWLHDRKKSKISDTEEEEEDMEISGQSPVYIIEDDTSESAEMIVPDIISTPPPAPPPPPSKATRARRKRPVQNNKVAAMETAVINAKGIRVGTYRRGKVSQSTVAEIQTNLSNPVTEVNPSLQRGLKILAAAVPPEVRQTLLNKRVASTTSDMSIKTSNGLVIRPAVNATQSFQSSPESSQGSLNNSIANITPATHSISPFQQNNNLTYSLGPSDVFLQLPGNSVPPLVLRIPSPAKMPKIASVHSQFSPDDLTASKLTKYELISKDIEDNPSIYLGVGKREIYIIKLISRSCQVTRKQIFLILRKMRHNEPVEILADLFEMNIDEVVKSIVAHAPRIAALFRKSIRIAAKIRPTNCILDRLHILVRKPSYLSEQPEEVSRYSIKVDLNYLISCTDSGFINFVSEGYESQSKYSNIPHLFKFLNSVNANDVYVVGKELRNTDKNYLHLKNVSVKTQANLCYRMNAVRAYDGIKQFKLLSNSEIPLRYEFYSIIDDFLLLACALYNCKVM